MSLTAEDRVEIVELVGRYNQAVDLRQAEAWADTFTEHGRFYAPPNRDVSGRDELIAMVESMGAPDAQHWTTNYVIDGDQDDAMMESDLIVFRDNGVGVRRKYLDTLQRVDGSWKFVLRNCVLHPSPPSEK